MELTLETSQELLTCRAEFASTQLASSYALPPIRPVRKYAAADAWPSPSSASPLAYTFYPMSGSYASTQRYFSVMNLPTSVPAGGPQPVMIMVNGYDCDSKVSGSATAQRGTRTPNPRHALATDGHARAAAGGGAASP